MLPGRIRLFVFFTVVAAAAALGVCPSASGQIAPKPQQTAAASGAPSQNGRVPLRVMLVIPDAVRAYRVRNRLAFATFGRGLANQAEKLFTRKFAAIKLLPTLPPGPLEAEGVDLVVIFEVPRGEYHSNGQISLSAGFEVRDAKGEEIFHAQEEAEGQISNNGEEQLGGSVVRDFLQELVLNERVQAMLAPKPAVVDTTEMDSGGLDAPPPPPWTEPPIGNQGPVPPPAANKTGKP